MASKVSKSLPWVLKVQIPLLGAVQRYQTDLPPSLPAWLGSPVSLVAVVLLPTRVPLTPLMARALPKLSLAGPESGVNDAALTAVPPGVPTAMAPAVTPRGALARI